MRTDDTGDIDLHYGSGDGVPGSNSNTYFYSYPAADPDTYIGYYNHQQ